MDYQTNLTNEAESTEGTDETNPVGERVLTPEQTQSQPEETSLTEDIVQERKVVDELEAKIRNGYFKTKDELFEEMVNIRNNGMVQILHNGKMRELLDLFDQLKAAEELPLDTNQYQHVSAEHKELIISNQEDRVLTTLEGDKSLKEEFANTQNEILANSNDGQTNAAEVFANMADYKKEEPKFISLLEASSHEEIDLEVLKKISFLISKKQINVHSFRINIETGMFYNIDTHEIFEVRKNENTHEYALYVNNEQQYQPLQEHEEEITRDQEGQNKNKPKVRVRTLPAANMHGFTKISFLIINIITFIALAAVAVILYK